VRLHGGLAHDERLRELRVRQAPRQQLQHIALARRQLLEAARRRAAAAEFPELTEREVELLRLIARGRTNQEIADALVLSLKTVSNYVSNIYGKLQVADRAQAVIRAREASLR
jgi:DNA-binding NarL/FixJ family response regulator